MTSSRIRFCRLIAAFMVCLCMVSHAHGGLGSDKGFEESFGFKPDQPLKEISFREVNCASAGNVFFPGDKPEITCQAVNLTDHPVSRSGSIELYAYSTSSDPDDTFTIYIHRGQLIGSVPVSIKLESHGFSDQAISLPVPERFGGYVAVLSLDTGEHSVLAACVRVMKPTPGRVPDPTYALDLGHPAFAPVLKRLGVKGIRQEQNWYAANDPKYAEQKDRIAQHMKLLLDNDITVMWTLEGGGNEKMPLSRPRGFLNDKAEGKMEYPGDGASSPQFDPEVTAFCKDMTESFGYPRGPINAIELWNEPWEGSSISGWGADILRYRELYTAMAQGIEAGRNASGNKVLIGGACSSMNTEDKLFCDGNDEPFLKWLDFTSIHYQPMCAEPALIKKFAQRKSPNGPTQAWDTESWIANSEDLVAGVIASMRAQGLARTAGVFHDALREVQDVEIRRADGKVDRNTIVQTHVAGAAVAAVQNFIGQRRFNSLLFQNGLPWIFVFDGLTGPDDGSVVIVGDLGRCYDRRLLAFRGVLGFAARQRDSALQKQLEALAPDAPGDQRNALLKQIKIADVLDQANLTLADSDRHFISYDFFGNPLPASNNQIVVPLNGLGYFVRTDGSPGSFARLIEALKAARVDGVEPVEIVAHDLLAHIDQHPTLRLTVTNILNRPVTGILSAKLAGATLEAPTDKISLAANETREIALPVSAGQLSPSNIYALSATFDAGGDGKVVHDEQMHVNTIAHRTIAVDGNLDDWKDVLPQPVKSAPGAGRNLTEKAWLPFAKFEDPQGQGYASGYLAYDDQNFYFAARIADATPYPGNIRFTQRDDDSYFFPEVAYSLPDASGKRTEFRWPAGVRRFSYRKDFLIPSGDSTDNVQIAFNVLPVEKTDWLAHAPGVMPRFEVGKSTDYEYALNTVADQFGGGTELWRLMSPGMPRKHFYPRQPKVTAPGVKDGGPVEGGKLVTRRDGSTRIVECAIPWSELPDVHERLTSGQTIKFTFRVNDDKGPSYELNGYRSVAKVNTYALHNYWQTSWEAETEFAFEK